MLLCAKRETNIWMKHKVLENHNWKEADQLAVYTARSWGDELGEVGGTTKSNEWQGGGLEPRTTRLQVQCPNQPSHTASARGKSQNTNSYHVVVWWKVLTFIFESKSLLYYCLGWSQVSPKHCRSSKSWKQATSWKDDWKRANNGVYGFHQQTSWQRWWWYWKTRHWHVGKTYHQITRSKLHLWKSARWYGQN